MRNVLRVLLGLSVIATTLTLATTVGATTLLGESKKGVAQAYAAVNTSTATVLAFGGKRATGASVAFCGGGFCQVTFTGNFPTDITTSKVLLNTTAQTSAFDVTNAIVGSATPTTIVVDVDDWNSSTLASQDDVIWVTVFVGQ